MLMDVIEFFFGNFWHWLGLFLIIAEICSGSIIRIYNKTKEDEK